MTDDLTLNDVAKALKEMEELLDKNLEEAPSMADLRRKTGWSNKVIHQKMEDFEHRTGLKIIAQRVSRPTRVVGENMKIPVYQIINPEETINDD